MTTHKVYVDTESLSKEELKELQMEKLRELLNEFEPYIQKDWEHRDNLWYGVICWESAIFTKEIWIQKIISKEYKFIKWLVEKNKIDRDKLKGNITFTSIWVCFDLRTVKEWESTIKAIWTDTIISYLSIQDKPIEFLISILK